jgi:acetamidase/formamidase
VEGAEAGDTLVLHLDSLKPNRDTGWSKVNLAPNVADPEAVADFPSAFNEDYVTWRIDHAAGTVSLVNPEGRMGNLTLPMSPMLGCFGVAPREAQAISTRTSAEHGGNMDYNGFVGGVTVYFPVFMPGALVFVGDGHALQGDGEISGTGIEISFDVQFTVNLIKGKKIEWPRGENADYIFTVGNARPLDQALQHATTEMQRWLQADYGLSAREANLLLSYTGKYEIANVFDPAYTMVCKLPKWVLPSA